MFKLTAGPVGPAGPGLPGSPRDPWGPSGPRPPAGPVSPCQRKKQQSENLHLENQVSFIRSLQNMFKKKTKLHIKQHKYKNK